jgi:Icc-related predicted phosphoesterase
MNTFLLCSGVNGQVDSLDRLQQAVEYLRPEGILFAGGVLALGRAYEPRATEWGISREDARFLERFYQAIGSMNVFTVLIPGAMDTPLDEFLRIGMHAEVEFPAVHIAHATLITSDGVAVIGLGGWVSEGPACELDCCSRTMAQYHLRVLADARQPHRILLLGRPPVGSCGKQEGSLLTAELIDSLRPSLCVTGGGDGGQRIQRVAHTLIVNPGYLSDGKAAWLDWRRSAASTVELLDLNADLRHRMKARTVASSH